jgi:hypothetical protein
VADGRLDILLRALERAPEPESAFAELLYRQLATQAGFGAAPRSWLGQLGRATSFLGSPLRLVWLVLLILLILLALLGFIAAGGAPQRPHLGVGPLTPSPSGAVEAVRRPTSSVLTVGQVPPAWSASLLDGGKLSSGALIGRPAAVFLWCSCSPGPQARTFAGEATARAGQMAFVLASLDEAATTRGLVDSLGYKGAVVGDGWPLLEAWGLSDFPAVVLFRPDGAVADVQPATFSAPKLAAILDALANGGTIPEPDPPAASLGPGDASLSTILKAGQPAPELRGAGLNGEQHSTLDLLGRPSIVLHWIPPDAAGQSRDDVPNPDSLVAELNGRAGTVNGLLIAQQFPADADAYLAARGSSLPVILDWSGELFDRWGLVSWPTAVALDSDGRVVALGGKDVVADPAPFIEAKLLTTPSP